MGKVLKIILLVTLLVPFTLPLYAESIAGLSSNQVVEKIKAAQQKLGPWEAASAKRDKLLAEKNYPAAIKAGKEALRIAENTFGAENYTAGASLFGLGIVYKEQGNYAQAEDCLNRSIDLYLKAFGPNKNLLTEPLKALASVYELENKQNQAQALNARIKALGYEK
jgi:tetratricopeptide (TPR) repeat protein